MEIKRSIYKPTNPRTLVNVLVILVKTPVNLLVKLTKLGQLVDSTSLWVPWEPWGVHWSGAMGAMGLGRA
jgi:hypothetical protein